MPAPLLSIKLNVPPLRSTLVSRPRLIEQLNVSLDCKLILVSAPAGYGKTTLLSNWIGCCNKPAAWISLDEGDNDLVRFLHYVIAALQKIEPRFGGVALSLLKPLRGMAQIEMALTCLLNEVARMPAPVVLILDDYHRITAQPIHDAVAFLLDHLPSPMHVVISTRSDPPLPIARLRARGELAELRQNDLRFTADETARFLDGFVRLNLSAEDIAVLTSRTEGWISGLQTAALSLQHHEDASEFIAQFAGSQHHILDYLVEEVLKCQPDYVQAFLLHTSILDRMSGPLCDAVAFPLNSSASQEEMQGRSGQAMLEYLEHANLFVLPQDEDLHWYRYHHLFADCLAQRLRQQAPDLIPELHRRAANWYRQNSYAVEAVSHLLAAGDWAEAAQLVEQSAMQMFIHGEVSILSAWLDRLPDELVRDRPWLCILRAWASIAGPTESIERCLEAAERALAKQGQPLVQVRQGTDNVPPVIQLRAHMAAIRAVRAAARGELVRAGDLTQQAFEQLPEESLERILTALVLGWVTRLRGDLEGSSQAFAEAKRVGLATSFTFAAVAAICSLGDNLVLQSRLRRAVENYEEALLLATHRKEQRSAAAGYTLMRLGDVYREWNDLETALRYSMEGIDLCKRAGYSRDWAIGYVTLARIYVAQNNLNEAQHALQNAWQLTSMPISTPMPDFLTRCSLQDCQARLWLAQADLAAAAGWKRTSEFDVTDEIGFGGELEHIILARVLIAQGQAQPEEHYLINAVSVLARLLDRVESMGWTGKCIEAMILQALAFQAQGQTRQALTALDRALTLAEPEGYVRIFIDEGAPMAMLLRQAALHGLTPEYVSRLLAAFGTSAGETGPLRRTETQARSLTLRWIKRAIEPLSERELEVLRLLPTELSSTDIADELCVSANTVRTHIRHIYDKLEVHNRYAAIMRAKELRLI